MSSTAQVAILMGSDSDWPKISAAAKALDEFGVAYEVRVMSAHRTPDLVAEYARQRPSSRGIRVFIAAAGGAAHLAGVVAAHTTLPVIGLPVPTEDLGGFGFTTFDGANAGGCAGRQHGSWHGWAA